MTLAMSPAVMGPVGDPGYRPAPWLPPDLGAVQTRIVRLAVSSVLTMEDPPGSNRGPEVDPLLRWAGVPEDAISKGLGYWCCAWATKQWALAGAEVPKTASCWALMDWGQRTGRFSRHVPSLGCFVFYAHDRTKPALANHVGLIVRLAPRVASVEGNTTVEGKGDERNGTAVAVKLVIDGGPGADPVLGYVHVHPQG